MPQGADIVSLIRVIHDHDDAAALTILRAARQALPPGGTLLLAEPMADTRGAEPVGAYFNFYLLAMGSGRPRRAEELDVHDARGGFFARSPGSDPAADAGAGAGRAMLTTRRRMERAWQILCKSRLTFQNVNLR